MGTDSGGPPYGGVLWTDDLEQHPESIRLISLGLVGADRWLRMHARDHLLTTQLMMDLHGLVFGATFPLFGGSIRGAADHQHNLEVGFGGHIGIAAREVPGAMDALGRDTINLIEQLDRVRRSEAPGDFVADLTRAASYVHCRLIEIHPFVNGNGRTARLCVNYFLRRYGLWNLPAERPTSQEYIRATEHFLVDGSTVPFAKFLRDSLNQQQSDELYRHLPEHMR